MKIIKKNGARYVVYKGKRYKLVSKLKDEDLSNNDIIRDLIKIIKKTMKKKKVKQANKKTTIDVKPSNKATIEGQAIGVTLDNPEQAKNLGVNVSSNTKLNSEKVEKQIELLDAKVKVDEEKKKVMIEEQRYNEILHDIAMKEKQINDLEKRFGHSESKNIKLEEKQDELIKNIDALVKEKDIIESRNKSLKSSYVESTQKLHSTKQKLVDEQKKRNEENDKKYKSIFSNEREGFTGDQLKDLYKNVFGTNHSLVVDAKDYMRTLPEFKNKTAPAPSKKYIIKYILSLGKKFEEPAKKILGLTETEIKEPTPVKIDMSQPSTPLKIDSNITSPSTSLKSFDQSFASEMQDEEQLNSSFPFNDDDDDIKQIEEEIRRLHERIDRNNNMMSNVSKDTQGSYEKENEQFIEKIQNLEQQKQQLGKGKRRHGGKIGDSSGLWSDEINKIMDKYKSKGFKGVYSIDELNKIPVNENDKEISFIMNTTPSNDNRSGHWIAVFINHDNVEYYDSFGDEPDKQFKKNIKQLLYKISPNKLLQFKINNIKRQNGNSNNCGYFAMKFLQDRYAGKHFKIATGFNIFEDSHRGEKEIKAFKKKLIPFNYI